MPATPLRSTLRTLCAAAIIGLPTGSWAATDDAMRDALNAARQQQWQQIDQSAIDGHILSGYVEYHRLRQQLPNVSVSQVLQFIEQHGDSPLGEWLRGQAIANYGYAGRFSDLLAVADGEPAGTARQCYYYTALLDRAPEQARTAGLALWRVGSSQPDACNALFNRLRADGTIDATAIWERKMLAWQAGEQRLSTYLGGLLSGQWQTAIDTAERANTSLNSLTTAPTCLGPECAATAAFYQAAMQRYTREDTPRAFAAWQQIAPRLTLAPSDQQVIEEELAFYAQIGRAHV